MITPHFLPKLVPPVSIPNSQSSKHYVHHTLPCDQNNRFEGEECREEIQDMSCRAEEVRSGIAPKEMIIEAKIVRMTKTTMFVISVLALVIHQFRNVEMTNTSIELEYRHT